jgi:beta-lactam-binding protein with PASTA domain/predicted Ser/Thr protein kinase
MIEAGTLIDDRYEVLSRIGSGGMADVYLARDRLLGRQVAVKLLQHRFAQDSEFVERFRREASSAAGLSHPNVVAVFDRGEWDGTYYIAMEYLPGKSLKTIVREQAPLDPAEAIEIVTQILRAARFAHKRGIIHRDLKPHNVILDEEGRAKVTDFGIARAGASDMTLTGSIMGTAQYLSPEQAQGHTVGETSDLYAVGIVLYELLTGRVPFDGETAVTIALKQVSAEPPRPSALNAAVSPELDAVVARALAKSPAARFGDAGEFIAALERARANAAARGLAGAGAPTAVVGSPPPAAPPLGALAAGAAAGALAGGALAADALAADSARAAGGPPPVRSLTGVPLGAPSGSSFGAPPNGPPTGGLLLPAAGEADGEQDPVRDAQRRRRRWWWAGGAAALALVAAGVALALLLGSSGVSVPSVTGQSQAVAVARLGRAGLTPVLTQTTSTSVPLGSVIAQSPRGGSKVKKGSRVSVVVSSGPGSEGMPKVVGLSSARALEKLRAAGLQPTTQSQPSAKVPEGTVISTVPSAGTDLQVGSGVVVVVSSGPQQVSVPELQGETQAEAKAALTAAGLKLGTVTQQAASAGQTAGTVLSQSPVAGTQLQTGQTVSLTVAQAPKETAVPEVVGQSETQAAAALGRAGFNPKSVSRAVSEQVKVGVVLKQSPAAGRLAAKGATVTIAVGVLEASTTTTSTSAAGTSTTSSTTTSTTTSTAAAVP